MTKPTPEVSKFLYLNHLQKHSFHLYFSKILLPWAPSQTSPRLGATLPRIIWLALGLLPSYAPGYSLT